VLAGVQESLAGDLHLVTLALPFPDEPGAEVQAWSWRDLAFPKPATSGGIQIAVTLDLNPYVGDACSVCESRALSYANAQCSIARSWGSVLKSMPW
jgi:hypothetical protein